VLSAIPDRARVIEHLKYPVTIFDGPVSHSGTAQRIDIVLIPSSQSGAIPQHEALEQRGASGDHAGGEAELQLMAIVGKSIGQIPAMTGVDEVTRKEIGGHAQVVACIQNLLLNGRIF